MLVRTAALSMLCCAVLCMLCREVLRCVARTALRTKLQESMADQLTDIVVDAVLTIQKPDQPLDLYMVSHPASKRASDSMYPCGRLGVVTPRVGGALP